MTALSEDLGPHCLSLRVYDMMFLGWGMSEGGRRGGRGRGAGGYKSVLKTVGAHSLLYCRPAPD